MKKKTRSCTLQRNPDAHVPIRLALALEVVKRGGILDDRDAHSFRFDLPDGPREPPPRPQEPAAESPQSDDADGNGGIVQRLAVDRIQLRQTEDDGDEADVQAGHGGDGSRCGAQVERTLFEIGWVDETDQDGKAV